ncbi:hypothetical protein [Streptomyces cadmiisoli]|uniref:hypothetical protein n=1 Tax=Streptomyces cadmiisoli TaxID=2184053 RepID=UPI003D74563C
MRSITAWAATRRGSGEASAVRRAGPEVGPGGLDDGVAATQRESGMEVVASDFGTGPEGRSAGAEEEAELVRFEAHEQPFGEDQDGPARGQCGEGIVPAGSGDGRGEQDDWIVRRQVAPQPDHFGR